MDNVPPRIVLGIDYGPDYDTVAVCAIDPDTGAVTLVSIQHVARFEPEVEVTEVTNASGEVYARVEMCVCSRTPPYRNVSEAHPKGSPGCYFEEKQ